MDITSYTAWGTVVLAGNYEAAGIQGSGCVLASDESFEFIWYVQQWVFTLW